MRARRSGRIMACVTSTAPQRTARGASAALPPPRPRHARRRRVPASPSTRRARRASSASLRRCCAPPAASASRCTARTGSSCRRSPARRAAGSRPGSSTSSPARRRCSRSAWPRRPCRWAGCSCRSMLACLGGALIWRQASDTERDRLRRALAISLIAPAADGSAGSGSPPAPRSSWPAAVLVLARADFTRDPRRPARVVVTVVGLALVTGPWWMRLMAQLGAERRERIRTPGARRHRRAPARLGAADARADPAQRRRRRARWPGWPAARSASCAPALRQRDGVRPARRRAAHASAGRGRGRVRGRRSTSSSSATPRWTSDARRAGRARPARRWSTRPSTRASTAVSLYAEVEDGAVRVFVRDRGVGLRPGRSRRRPAGRARLDPRPDGAARRHASRSRSRAGRAPRSRSRMPRAHDDARSCWSTTTRCSAPGVRAELGDRGRRRRRGRRPGDGRRGDPPTTPGRRAARRAHARRRRPGRPGGVGASCPTPGSWRCRCPTRPRTSSR